MKWEKSPARFLRAMQRRQKAVDRELGSSMAEAAKVVKGETDERVIIPRRISKQDAPGGQERALTGRSPVRTKVDTKNRRAIIRLATHYTRARTKGIIALFRRLGLSQELFRKSLIVQGRRLTLRTHPRLLRWARLASKGFQELRHVVRLKDSRAREDLILGPALAASEQRVTSIWRRAFSRGMRG